MAKLSVVITAFNEEQKIEECLKSVKFTDEIILIDSSSTDKTVEIGHRYTSKIFTRPNNPMLNVNKNFGFQKATGDWILSLDSDERITDELKKEIQSIIKNDKKDVNGFWIPRKNIIFGKWVEHTGWYPDHQLRLFKKGKGRFEEKHVHEMVKVEGKTDYLKNHIVHYNYETVHQFLQKLANIYAPNEADYLIGNGYKFEWRDAIRLPLKEFLSRFFAREGYKDGFHGLILSIFMAFYQFVVFANIWEKQGFITVEDERLLQETEEEFKSANKQLFFWFGKEKNRTTTNPLKRIIYKLASRLG